jgi:hypothetical protein
MLKASPEEKEEVREYFEWQASDLEITFMQKVYSESVLSARHDVWDIHTNEDRWWVITDPTNLYSQDQFPNMDLALTFHIGLCLRIPRSEAQQTTDARIVPFGSVFTNLEEVGDAVSQASKLADYQAVGVRSRETLLKLVGVAQDAAIWTDAPPKRADYRGWIEIICNQLLPGDSNRERRGALKSAMETAWTFSNWLTHAKSATWLDADMAHTLIQHAIGMATSLIVRELRGVPPECPNCGSPDLDPEQGENIEMPGVTWERPRCADCGWVGRPVPLLEAKDVQALVTREGAKTHEHSIMTVPLRAIRKPGDPPISAPNTTEDSGSSKRFVYFAYGSNMLTAWLRTRTPSCRAMGTATLSNHVLRFHKRSQDNSGKCNAFHTGNADDRVIGVLFRIDASERPELDKAEGLGKGYDEAWVTVIDGDGRRKKALTYLAAPDFVDDTLQPYSWYKDFVLSGATEHGIPVEYIRQSVFRHAKLTPLAG